jgi:hypothetical protein
MKKLINKVLLALITLSVATPVSAEVDLAMLKGIGKFVTKGVIVGFSGVGGMYAGGAIGLGIVLIPTFFEPTVNPYSPENMAKSRGRTHVDEERDNEKALAHRRISNIIIRGGALLGACTAMYLAFKKMN